MPVLKTNALTNEGVDKLLTTIDEHRTWLEESGQLEARRRDRAEGRIRDVVNRELMRIAWRRDEVAELLRQGVAEIAVGEETPYSVSRRIVEALLR